MKTSAKALTAGIVGLAIIDTSATAFSSQFEHDGDHDRDSHNPEMVNQASLSADQAIAIANDSDYGLAASLFSANGKQALRAAREVRAGTVTINCYGEGDITTPFGGYKQSGFGGRDNSLHAHDQYTELKTIWIDLSDRNDADRVD